MTALFHLLTGLLLYPFFSSGPAEIHSSAVTRLEIIEKETEELIPWSYERMLSWDDFLCEPVRNTDAVALTSTTLGLSYKYNRGHLKYDINCSFSKKKSWGILKTPYILAHEQAHFDIAEIFARKLNRELKRYQPNLSTIRKDIGTIYNKVVEEEKAFQELYDDETSHSRKKRKQEEWLDKIDDLLEESEPFANYP